MSEQVTKDTAEIVDDGSDKENRTGLGKVLASGAIEKTGLDKPKGHLDQTDEGHEVVTAETLQRIHDITSQLPHGLEGSTAEQRHYGHLFDEELGVGVSVVDDHASERGLSVVIATAKSALSRTPYWSDRREILEKKMPELAAEVAKGKSLQEQKDDFIKALDALGVPDIDKISKRLQDNIDLMGERNLPVPFSSETRTTGYQYVIKAGTIPGSWPNLKVGVLYGVDTVIGLGYSDQKDQLTNNQGQRVADLLERTLHTDPRVKREAEAKLQEEQFPAETPPPKPVETLPPQY